MKGTIIIPTFFDNKKRQSKGVMIRKNAMYKNLCKKYNFSIQYTDSPELDDFDVAIITCVPYHNRPNLIPGLLDTKCKLIGEFWDLQCWDNEECIKNKKILFDRYDALLGSYYYLFRKWYPQHIHKYFYLPNYFGPYEKYANIPLNNKPIMRCLLIGARYKAYPRRRYVYEEAQKHANGGFIDAVNGIPYNEYPNYINKYFCALALPGELNMPVAKYFEIPAAGTLLLATEVEEAKTCGLQANIHYVPVTRKNVFQQIHKVLYNPDDYIEMRNGATKFVLENHSDLNRFEIYEDIFKRLFPDGYEFLLR